MLSRRPSGEADRLVTFFTREHGLLRAVAKGVRKIPSRRGGHLEPYTQVLTILTVSRAGAYVGAVEAMDHFAELQGDEASLLIARNITSTILGLFEEGDVQAELYDAVQQAWGLLPTLSPAKAHVLEATLMSFALRQAGMMPNLTACQRCGVKVPTESIVLEASQGGWRCLLCHGGFSGTQHSMPPALLKVLRFIYSQPAQALRVKLDDGQASHLLTGMRAYVAQVIEQPIHQELVSYG